MSVGSHLQIRLEEYDSRIRTFIPAYEQMLAAAAGALKALEVTSTPHIVDLGTGTGALAACCLSTIPGAFVTAIDEDGDILAMARERLAHAGAVASFLQRSFLDVALPSCDAIVASLALHHVRTADRKRQLYRDCHAALGVRGLLISADCCPSADEALAAVERAAWREHLRVTYSDEETDRYFAAWAQEDVYVPLSEELALFREAGFLPEVVWRQGSFAVLAARRM
jgi:SAM-dependent methyltransferase